MSIRTSKSLFYLSIIILISGSVWLSSQVYFEIKTKMSVLEIKTEKFTTNPQSFNWKPAHLLFVENKGQLKQDIKYHVQGSGLNVFFYPDKVVFNQANSNTDKNEIRLTFTDANRFPIISTGNKLISKVNYYLGNDSSKWATNNTTYANVTYHQLYKGIDLKYIGNNAVLESEFYVAPGINYKNIKFKYEGTQAVTLGAEGELILRTDEGLLIEKPPYAYQDKDGERIKVESKYTLLADGNIGFEVGKYDQGQTLVIDPELIFETTSGEKVGAWAEDVAVDASGNLIVVGASNHFYPATEEIDESNHSPGLGNDGLLLKINGQTGEIMSSALFGGI